MSQESPKSKRARVEGPAGGSVAGGAPAAPTAEVLAEAATPSRRRRRTPSPRRASGAKDKQESAAAAPADEAVAAAPAQAAAPATAAVPPPVAPAAADAGKENGTPAAPPAAKQQLQQPKQQQQQQQQQQDQQQEQEDGQKLSKKQRKKQRFDSPAFQLTIALHQCVKRDLPHEALFLYRRIKELGGAAEGAAAAAEGAGGARRGGVDAGTCSALLNLLVGKWQWELHQRHQHLSREAAAAGRPTAQLDAALAAIVAAALEQRRAEQEADGNIMQRVALETGSVVGGQEVPPQMVCHIEKHVELAPQEKLRDQAWLDGLLQGMPPERPPLTELLRSVAGGVVEDLRAGGGELDEQVRLQLARVAGIMGDPDEAFEHAREVVAAWEASGRAARLVPRLRDFQPAMVGYALTGQADKADAVVRVMAEQCGLDLTEPEFALWLEAIAAGGSYEQMSRALHAAAAELNELRGGTVDLVDRFFRSDRAAAALAPGGALAALGKAAWRRSWVSPSEQGEVPEAGVRLALTDLSEADWDSFAGQVQQLAEQQERQQGKFKLFADWLRRHGPHDVMVDGANVALWGENYEGGAFRPAKIRVMLDALRRQNPGARPLLVLHSGRYNDVRQRHPDLHAWLDGLHKQGCFFVVPGGSNDDWYWMYAAVQARDRGLLVSNDQLRDHVWNLLRPKHMLKWTQRHIVRFTFNYEKTEVQLQYPLPYTPCVQHGAETGAWLVPAAERGGQWLCCCPE